ncbi:unnamed protein product [Diamesa serratosioi]
MKLVLVILCLSPILANMVNDSAPLAPLTTYDQRQTGKFNIHISVKDVQFLSLSDSVGSVGDYDSYPEYDYDGDGDYDESHLTVNPIFGLLGTGGSTMKPKPTTKPTTTTTSVSTTTIQANDTKPESDESEDKMTIKESSIVVIKPTQPHKNVSEAIDYEEIPVEVQYYRNSNSNNNNNNINHQQQQQKVQINSRHAPTRYRPRPSVQIIGDNTESRNVKIVENDRPPVKICSSSEFRDKNGRCRVRSRRRSVQGGVM